MSSDSAAHSYASGVAAYAYACAEAAAAPAPAAYHAWQYHHENSFMFSIWTYFNLLRVSTCIF
jgi:hypothetical protein